jgi:hypothetical protein
MLWNGIERVKNEGNDSLKGIIPSADNDGFKTAGECGIFQRFG